ncbi:MAG: DHH family phosphoesterase [Candidatus Edwardsbacteria bacterium]
MKDTLFSPFSLPDIETAISRLIQAIERKEKIVIYGHDDVDGITSTVLMCEVLKGLKSEVSYYIPNRLTGVYGLEERAVKKFKAKGIKLIVTVDCGTTNHQEIIFAKNVGIDVIITDHHEVSQGIPPALAFVNPKSSDSVYPFRELAGVGVAYKIAQTLVRKKLEISLSQWYEEYESLLELVALGTIADRVPLSGENFYLTELGLSVISETVRSGIKAIKEISGIEENRRLEIDEVNTLFLPLLSVSRFENSSLSGRNDACELLITNDLTKAREIASSLKQRSEKWQEEAESVCCRLGEIMEKTKLADREKILVIVEERTGIRFLGYCAGKLKERYLRPVVVIGYKEDYAVGEARSIPEFDLIEAFKYCADLFKRYGGHKQAAGFSLEVKDIEKFKGRIREYGENYLSNTESANPTFI